MYEFKSVVDAQDVLEIFPHSVDAEKYYISSIQVYFSAFKLCRECEVKFKPKRKDQVYCSTKCGDRVRAREYRARKKAEKAAARKVDKYDDHGVDHRRT